jgi:hypothetical protein
MCLSVCVCLSVSVRVAVAVCRVVLDRWLCQESRVKGQNEEEAQACIELAMVVLKEQVSGWVQQVA